MPSALGQGLEVPDLMPRSPFQDMSEELKREEVTVEDARAFAQHRLAIVRASRAAKAPPRTEFMARCEQIAHHRMEPHLTSGFCFSLDRLSVPKSAPFEQSDAHAPPSSNFHTGMPKFRALSARLAEIPEPGKTITPIGSTSSMASLRLKGAVFSDGLKPLMQSFVGSTQCCHACA